tara:strand:+ start:4463 stop:5188 length:726 start_codon:yes stop_codon:yes gene_type:complete
MDHRMGLHIGGLDLADFDTKIQVGQEGGSPGTPIDLESDLALGESTNTIRADLWYQPSRRHRFELSWYDISRRSTDQIDQDIEFGGQTFPVNMTVHTVFDTEIYRISYRYNFLVAERWQVGASVGIHQVDLVASISTTDGSIQEQLDTDAPAPLFGIHGAYAITPSCRMVGSVELLDVQVSGLGGFINDNRLALEFDLFEHVGLGIGWNGFLADVDVNEAGLSGKAEYKYSGWMFYLRGLF